jgi:hypothetical protein
MGWWSKTVGGILFLRIGFACKYYFIDLNAINASKRRDVEISGGNSRSKQTFGHTTFRRLLIIYKIIIVVATLICLSILANQGFEIYFLRQIKNYFKSERSQEYVSVSMLPQL